jgi:Carboxypeptidase regulatory-like domain
MRDSASKVCSVLSVLLLFGAAISAPAQAPTASVRGIISDPSKAIISGAKVTITDKEKGAERTVQSNSAGEYQFSALTPGEYEIKITMNGFKSGLRPLTLRVGENLTVDIDLEIGQTTDTVVISSETPAISTTDYKVDGVVSRRQIDSLPLNGRNFMQLGLLEPGVGVDANDNPGSSPNNFFRLSVAGASQAQTRISVDGATINDRVTGGTAQNFSQESVQEFQISTFNFDPSTSVTSVGSINVISRSGSNEFHGTAFMYYRDHNLGAYPLLKRGCEGRETSPLCTNPDARKRLDDPFFARRQMGGSIGGPIRKDKVFFFFNGEYNNQDNLVLVNNNHPIWSKFDGPQPQPLTFKQTNTKVDFRVSEKHSAFVRVSTDNNRNLNADGETMPSYWVPTRNVSTQGLGGLTSVLTPKLVNDLRFSYGYYSGRLRIPTSEDCPDPVACVGLGGSQLRMTLAPLLRIGNNVNVPQNRVLRTYQLTDTVSWQKSSHRVRFGGEWERFYGVGSWAFLEPALYILYDPTHLLALVAGTGGANSPVLPFYNALPASLRLNATGTGPLNSAIPTYQEILRLPVFQFLTGIGDPGQPPGFRQSEAARSNRFRLFATDQWRVTSRFTMNYGVSYSIETNILNHDLDRPRILSALLGNDLRAPQRDRNNVDPSFGFAWDMRGNGKTVIRGGSGVYHDSNLFWTRINERAYVGPSGNGRSIIPSSFYGLDFSDPRALIGSIVQNRALTGQSLTAILPQLRAATLAQIGNGQNLSVRGLETFKTTGNSAFGGIFSPDTVTPYSINVSAGVQHELRSDMVLTADFVMRRSLRFGGLHDTLIIDRNRFNSAAGPVIPRCTSAAQSGNPQAICSNGPIAVSHSGANYRYTGLHIKADKRFSNRYQFVGSYALSKYTGFNPAFPGDNSAINLNNFNEGYDYQLSHRRHRFTFSGFVELPEISGGSRALRGLANGWQLGMIMPIVSAPPLPSLIRDADLDGDGTDWTMLPGGTYSGFGSRYGREEVQRLVDQFNSTQAGKTTPRGQPIPRLTLPANFDNGDTFISQDLRLTRSFKLREQLQLQVIGEVFNVFNISNLAIYGFTLNAPGYGVPTRRAGGTFGTGVPRAFQFAARLSF